MNQGVVYWKHLPGMDRDTEGYIGISKHFEERMKQHHRDAFVRNSIYTVHEAMRSHGDNIITEIIFEGDYNECLDLELELRSKWHTGWNMAIGGGRPGSGWKPNPLWLCNRLWHATHGELTISKDLTITDLEKTYLDKPSTHVAKVLLGQYPSIKGWELANAQLAQKVKERYYKPWTQTYMQKDNIGVYIERSKYKTFCNHFNLNSSAFGIKQLINNARHSKYGWEIISKEEYNNTKERLEFK